MGLPLESVQPIDRIGGGLMHLQFVSDLRLRSKQLLYCLTEQKRWPGRKSAAEISAMYSRAVYGGNDREAGYGIAPVPEEWWGPYSHLMEYLKVDAAPWQLAECRAMLTEQPELANGLDTFGLFPWMASA